MTNSHSWLGPEVGLQPRQLYFKLTSVPLASVLYSESHVPWAYTYEGHCSESPTTHNVPTRYPEAQTSPFAAVPPNPFRFRDVHQIGFDREHKDLLVSIHSLTVYAGVVHQNDLLQQYCRRRIEHAVDGAEQRGPCFVMKDYYDAGGRQGRAALKFLLNTSRGS